MEKEIIVVDDASTDGTVQIVKAYIQKHESVKLILHTKNKGKGAAVQSALAETTGDIVIIQDADLEYDPADYNKMLFPIFSGRADVVYGSRFMGSGHTGYSFSGIPLVTNCSHFFPMFLQE